MNTARSRCSTTRSSASSSPRWNGRTSRAGRDSVDHPPHGADDVANAAAGALVLAARSAQSRRLRRSRGPGIPKREVRPFSDDGSAARHTSPHPPRPASSAPCASTLPRSAPRARRPARSATARSPVAIARQSAHGGPSGKSWCFRCDACHEGHLYRPVPVRGLTPAAGVRDQCITIAVCMADRPGNPAFLLAASSPAKRAQFSHEFVDLPRCPGDPGGREGDLRRDRRSAGSARPPHMARPPHHRAAYIGRLLKRFAPKEVPCPK